MYTFLCSLPIADLSLKQIREHFDSLTKDFRKTTYISCWHGGETESAAMWELYGTSTGSIAIQSTYGKLAAGLPDIAHLGVVRYIRYDSFDNWIPKRFVLSPFMYKRKEFEHENEVRALITRSKNEAQGNPGFKVDIDIAKVIETIRVQPTTPAWIRAAIERLLERYGWGIKIMPSEIDVEPLY